VFKETVKEKPELIEEVAKEEFLTQKKKFREVIELPIITEPEKSIQSKYISIPPSYLY
jgi:hypothetical protein